MTVFSIETRRRSPPESLTQKSSHLVTNTHGVVVNNRTALALPNAPFDTPNPISAVLSKIPYSENLSTPPSPVATLPSGVNLSHVSSLELVHLLPWNHYVLSEFLRLFQNLGLRHVRVLRFLNKFRL